MSRPLAPLSLDLDNKWSYLKTHGDSSWESFPSYYDIVVPRVLSILDELGITITFFVVGKDAEVPEHREHLQSIVASGHDVGSHSYLHEPWLHLYQREQLRADLEQAHAAISQATGVEPRGFRGPGFSLSNDTLVELRRLGYTYDATVFPNLLNPVGRAYYFMTSDLTPEEKEQRKALFGTLADARRPNVPFEWDLGSDRLTEIPVTTVPGIRIPFHFSYLIYLAAISEGAAVAYLRSALRLCRLRGVAPSLLLHPLDFMGADDDSELSFFPGMKMRSGRKLEIVVRCLKLLTDRYEVVSFDRYLPAIEGLRTRVPDLVGAS